MSNIELSSNPEFNSSMEKIEITTPVHADVMNERYKQMLENELYLKNAKANGAYIHLNGVDLFAAIDAMDIKAKNSVKIRAFNCPNSPYEVYWNEGQTTLNYGDFIVEVTRINANDVAYFTCVAYEVASTKRIYRVNKVNGTWGEWECSSGGIYNLPSGTNICNYLQYTTSMDNCDHKAYRILNSTSSPYGAGDDDFIYDVHKLSNEYCKVYAYDIRSERVFQTSMIASMWKGWKESDSNGYFQTLNASGISQGNNWKQAWQWDAGVKAGTFKAVIVNEGVITEAETEVDRARTITGIQSTAPTNPRNNDLWIW